MPSLTHISEKCILQLLRSSARIVTQSYESKLKTVDLTASQFSTLVAIGRQEGVTVSLLSERLGMDRTTMTRILKPLERRGLILISPSSEDSRAKAVHLKPSGNNLLLEAIPIWEEAQNQAIAKLGTENWADVQSVLKRLSE